MLKKYLSPILWAFVILSFFSCSSGKKALQRGEYDLAVRQSVNRLKDNPGKKRVIKVLQTAYPLAIESHLNKIRDARASLDPFRFEIIVSEFEAIHSLIDEVRSCPSCMNSVSVGDKYISDLNDAKLNAADARYRRGVKLLDEKNRASAKLAYVDFEKAMVYVNDYKDSRIRMEDAYQMALVRVLVNAIEIHSSMYKLNAELFQNRVKEYISTFPRSSFVQFYTQEELSKAGVQANHVMTMAFDDFQVGNTYVSERSQNVVKDGVVVGRTRDGKPLYASVLGTYYQYEKTVTSSGVLDVRILDNNTKQQVNQESIRGSYVWRCSWGRCSGDERAFDRSHLRYCAMGEQYPPSHQQMFAEFTSPIYYQFIDRLKDFYSRY